MGQRWRWKQRSNDVWELGCNGAGNVEMKEQQGGMEMEVKVWQRGGDWVLGRWRREVRLGGEGVKKGLCEEEVAAEGKEPERTRKWPGVKERTARKREAGCAEREWSVGADGRWVRGERR